MDVSAVIAVLLCVCVALSASQTHAPTRPPAPPPHHQDDLHPWIGEGFETVWLDDMSWVSEIHPMYSPQENFSFLIYGSNTMRRIRPTQDGKSFIVGPSPDERWHLPFISLSVFQNGTDTWGFGPMEGFMTIDPLDPHFPRPPPMGFTLDVAVITNKGANDHRNYDMFAPLGYESTFFNVAPVVYKGEIHAYFVGYWPEFDNRTLTAGLYFGVQRAVFDAAADRPNEPPQNWTRWYTNHTLDRVNITENDAHFITFNQFHKPHIFHNWNVTIDEPDVTYTTVVNPGTMEVRNIKGNIDRNVPLHLSHELWFPQRGDGRAGGISSAAVYYPHRLLILGVTSVGTGTGDIVYLHIANLTERSIGRTNLPANYSDPKALIVDEWTGHLYVGMNGGGAVLRIHIETGNITGYQRLPPYLGRAWRGHNTPEHLYFVTNEQYGKVFRLSKENFCRKECPEFGWCERGECVCPRELEMRDGECRLRGPTTEGSKAGEAVLGVFFAIAFVAAVGGWYLVWKNKRQGYQAV